MNHKTFLDAVKAAGHSDSNGWVTLTIGRYRIRTNGIEWSCITNTARHPVTRLAVVIAEWEKERGNIPPKTTGKN